MHSESATSAPPVCTVLVPGILATPFPQILATSSRRLYAAIPVRGHPGNRRGTFPRRCATDRGHRSARRRTALVAVAGQPLLHSESATLQSVSLAVKSRKSFVAMACCGCYTLKRVSPSGGMPRAIRPDGTGASGIVSENEHRRAHRASVRSNRDCRQAVVSTIREDPMTAGATVCWWPPVTHPIRHRRGLSGWQTNKGWWTATRFSANLDAPGRIGIAPDAGMTLLDERERIA